MLDRLATVLVLASLAACSSYPDEWPPLERRIGARFSRGCPDVTGTFQLVSRGKAGGRVPLSQTFLADVTEGEGQRWRWETMTITGSARDSLVVTVERSDSVVDRHREELFERGRVSPEQWRRMQTSEVRWSGRFPDMTDDEYADNLGRVFGARRGVRVLYHGNDYTCSGGWLRAPRVVHDPGPDRNNPRPDSVIGETLVARTTAGDLVAQAVWREEKSFSVWCGDGCRGGSLGEWTTRAWGRWPKTARATTTEDPRPWATNPGNDEPFDDAASHMSTTPVADIERTVRRFSPRDIESIVVERAGKGYRLVATSRTRGTLDRLLDNLRKSYRFSDVRAIGATRSPAGGWSMRLWLTDVPLG